MAEVAKIKAEDFKDLLAGKKTGHVVDVREPVEFAAEKIAGAKNVPVSSVAQRAAEIPKDQTVYLLCQKGGRACTAAEKLRDLGYGNVVVVEGGLDECKRKGIPVETGEVKVWALERQVRFTAGSLVLTGIILSWMIHPGFIGLSLFVGAGLVFSSVTNTCGMGLLLAKMPWNRVRN